MFICNFKVLKLSVLRVSAVKKLMTKVKICGITNLEDAILSVKFGADALGFNFYTKSPRCISPEKAREIGEQLPPEILKVGVFVNEDLEKIIEIAVIAKLDALQLHGEETPEFVRGLKNKFPGEIIKAFRISEIFKPEDVLQFEADAVLLDAFSKNEHGGTGETFDWKIAKKVQEIFPKMYLAGGLSAENVARAIFEIKPFAVDACSLIEKERGLKNANKLELFFQNIQKTKFSEKLIYFEKAVKTHFHFLETDYGFVLRGATTNYNFSLVRFESDKVWVESWYFLPHYDCDVGFGLLNKKERFVISDLISLGFNLGSSKNYTFENLNETEIIERNVSGFAEFFRKNGNDCLKGNLTVYQQLKENRENISRIYTERIETEQLKKQAEIAWRKGNYAQVVKNYKMIEKLLSPVERKKLDYAEKNLSNE